MDYSNIETIEVYGAYGRRYGTEEAMKIHWEEGLDFQVYSFDGGPRIRAGHYISKRDHEKFSPQAKIVFITDHAPNHRNTWQS